MGYNKETMIRDFLDLAPDKIDEILHSLCVKTMEIIEDDVPKCLEDRCEILDDIDNNG